MPLASGERSYREQLDELRCHNTAWLKARERELLTQERRLQLERLAVIKVLDERHALSPMPDVSVSPRATRTNLQMARSLEALPAVAEQMAAGALSAEQLAPLTELATPETDQEWARRGPSCSPTDLHHLVRRQERPTGEDARARRNARMLRIWREHDTGMVAGRFRLADIDGVLVEKVFLELTEKMRPATGQPWDSLEHRQADALVQLARDYSDVEVTQRTRSRPQIVFHRRVDGAIDCNGFPIAPETVTALLDDATAKLLTEDTDGTWIDTTRARGATPPGAAARRERAPQIDGLTLVPEDEPIDARAGPAP
jgi:hypothetical protein